MKTIKKLKGQRWFIWAIVVAVGGLVWLTVYINNTAQKDQADVPVSIAPAKKVVVSSIKPKLPVTQAEAVTLVKGVAEVKDYVARITAARGKAVVTAEGGLNTNNANSPYWTVHVYGIVQGKTTTYNFYNVYSKSGVIEEQN